MSWRLVDSTPTPSSGSGWFALTGLFLVGTAIDALCRYRPAELPYFMPWEFSWPVFLATFVTLGWFWRGFRRLPASVRPSPWRIGSFIAGLGAEFAVLQTHVDFLAQHMFFIHRAAHFVLLYPAPMLIAWSASGPTIRAGMPAFPRPAIEGLRTSWEFIRRPAIAPALFIGLLYFWLIPKIHTRAMLDGNLHDAMDWSIALSGLVFWSFVLDRSPATLSIKVKIAQILLVLLPQVALGAVLWRSAADVYPIYAICGRILALTALDDQHYGGLILALLSTVMTMVAIFIVTKATRRSQVSSLF
jgi:putative membrane protein